MTKPTIVLDVDEPTWVQLYVVEGWTLAQLAARFGRNTNVIKRHLVNAGIELRGQGSKHPNHKRLRSVFEDRCQEVVDLRAQGLYATQIAERLGIPYAKAARILRVRGLSAKTAEWTKRYSVDDSFFDVIDTETKAYWLGFLLADGGTHDNGVVLHLAAKDRSHIELFKETIKSDNPIVDTPGRYPSSTLTFSSTKIALVIRQAKAEMTIPDIDPWLVRHWLRGYWDGDGHINPNGLVELVGPHQRLQTIADYLFDEVHAWSTSLRPVKSSKGTSTVSDLRYSRFGDAIKIVQFLYADCQVVLPRKLRVATFLTTDPRADAAVP